jgi:hypothetical protein
MSSRPLRLSESRLVSSGNFQVRNEMTHKLALWEPEPLHQGERWKKGLDKKEISYLALVCLYIGRHLLAQLATARVDEAIPRAPVAI